MNRKFLVLVMVIIFCGGQIFLGCAGNTNSEKYDLIRIHIRADSNLAQAQAVKLEVRDRVTSYLTAELNGIMDYSTAYKMIGERMDSIRAVADGALAASGFGYKASARLNNEYFPTRDYDGVVVVSGYYDALIIELGSGKGDNWWCVIYPPLCYITASGDSGEAFGYKSWFKEMYDKFFGKQF